MTRYLTATGSFRTDNLFVEKKKDAKYPFVYTLAEVSKEIDGVVYPSVYEIYMDSVDEYDAAMRIVGSVAHWNKLCGCKWFMQGWPGYPAHRGLQAWREDMKSRDLSLAKSVLMDAAKKGSHAAAKTLSDVVKQEHGHTKGRPKTEDIAREAAKVAEADVAMQEDIKRLNVFDFPG